MKTCLLFVTMVVTGILAGLPARADDVGRHAASGSVRIHRGHSDISSWPYEDGDVSLGAAYEYREKYALVQLQFDWTPNPSVDGVDYVLTPRANLLAKDHFAVGGLGISESYIRDEDANWTGLDWQFILGLQHDDERFIVSLLAFYPFDDWSELNNFRWNEVEYGLSLAVLF